MSGFLQTLLANRPHPATASAVSYVGACTPQVGSGPSSNVHLALPAGCVVGDVVLACVTADDSAWTGSAQAGSTLLASQWWGVDNQAAGVFAIPLAAADITNGYVSVTPTTNSHYWGLLGAVWRNVSEVFVDVATSVNYTSSNSATYNITATGVTTVTSGDALAAFFAPDVAGIALGSFTTPAGYTRIGATAQEASDSMLAYALQPTAGATGNATSVYTNADVGDWCAFLVALKPKTPAITISYTLPSGTVGAAYTGSVSATCVDGAAAPSGITITGLPAGLSAGTMTHTGNVYTVPITGTPTTAATSSVSMSATNGTQSGSANHNVTIVAAGAITRIAAVNTSGATSRVGLTSPAFNIQTGDLIVVKYWVYDDTTVPESVTDLAGNTYALAVSNQPAGGGHGSDCSYIYYATASASYTSNTVSVAQTDDNTGAALFVETYRGHSSWTLGPTQAPTDMLGYATPPAPYAAFSTTQTGVVAMLFTDDLDGSGVPTGWSFAGTASTKTIQNDSLKYCYSGEDITTGDLTSQVYEVNELPSNTGYFHGSGAIAVFYP